MNKTILGIGAGVAAVAVVGTIGYRHFVKTGAQPAAAATPSPATTPEAPKQRVITIGGEAQPPAAPGKVVISPVTPKQMPPKVSELMPKAPAATQPAAPQPAAPQPKVTAPALVKPSAAKPTTRPATQPAQPKSAQPKKKVISLTGDPQAAAPKPAAQGDAPVDPVALETRGVQALSPKDKERYTLSVLDVVRGQIALYAQQHNGRLPDFAKYPDFEQLFKPTTADGDVVEAKAPGQTVGPYIQTMPVNGFNGRHKVAVVAGEVRPGQRVDRSDAGFVFSTSTNRFLATDANGLVYDDGKARAGYVPADAGGTGAFAKSDGPAAVQALRKSIELYRQHHNGRVPDFTKYPRWEQLAGKTRADGKPDPAGPFGPYLFNKPVNSRNNSSDVDVVRKVARGYKPQKPAGYVFETSTAMIFLTDEVGAVVTD